MDRITEPYLDEFSKANGIDHLPQDTRFEHFATYVALRRQYSQTFDTADIVVGSGGDTGIDAIAIIVNGVLVTDVETFTEQAKRVDYLDVLFVFVQAERSPSFGGAKISTFTYGLNNFFKNTPTLPRDRNVAAAAEIMAAINRFSGTFKHGNLDCKPITLPPENGRATQHWRRAGRLGSPIARIPICLVLSTSNVLALTRYSVFTGKARMRYRAIFSSKTGPTFPKYPALPKHI